MSIEISALQRIAVTEEASGSFAVDVTGSATYLDVPFQEGTAQLTLNRPPLEPATAQQYHDAYPLTVLGPKSATLTFTMVLAPTGVVAGDGDDSPAVDDSALLQILKTGFGGIDDSNTGTDVATAASATAFTLTAGSDIVRGGALGWADATGKVHARVLGNDGGSLVLKTALPSTPSVSDVIYASTTIYPTDNPLTSFQYIVEGAEQDDRWLLMGGQMTTAPQITRVNGELPTVTFTFEFANWASEPSAAITPATYSNFAPGYVHGEFRMKVAGAGTTTRNLIDASQVSYTLNGPAYQKITSPSGTNTVSRFRRSRAVPFGEIQVTLPYEDTTWFTERDDREVYYVEDQIGTAAGGIILLEWPRCQVVDVQRVDDGGIASQVITLRTTIDTDTVGYTASAMRYAATRWHFL